FLGRPWGRSISRGLDPFGQAPVARPRGEASTQAARVRAAALQAFFTIESAPAAKATDRVPYFIVLLGGEAGLRCGEMMALEWSDVDLVKRQFRVERSDWKGHVTATKGGRVRHVPMTIRLVTALREHRHLRAARVLCQGDGSPLTQKIVQNHVSRSARR